jgi:Ras-related protein Rab-32
LKIKCDLSKENLANNNQQMNEFCQDKGFIGWFETSAKDDINVEQAAKFLVSKILEKENALKQEEEKQTSDKLILGQDNNSQPKKSKCCK